MRLRHKHITLHRPRHRARLKPTGVTPAQLSAIRAGEVPLATTYLPRRVKLQEFLRLAFTRVMDADLGTSAAALTYYTILSLFPLLILVGNLLPLFGFSYANVSTYLAQVVPKSIMGWMDPVIQNLINTTSGSLLSISAVGTVWVASLSVNGLKDAFNKAYGVKPPQNFFVQRLISMVFIFTLIFALGLLMIVFAFGRQFLEWLVPVLGLTSTWLATFNALRWPVTVMALVVAMCIIDYFLPNVKMRFWTILPGAAFTVASWLVLAQGFSYYMRYFGTRFSSYGTIGTFIVLLLWLNFSALMLLIGAVINALVAEYYTGHIHHSRGKLHDFVQKYGVENHEL